MDSSEQERANGKTIISARAYFQTPSGRRVVLLDSPGHKGFIGSMIESAAQADVAVLVTSARKGEFEAGLERSGQTSEHALILYISGVRSVIVAVNKMDDSTCEYSRERYEQIVGSMSTFLTRQIGFKAQNIQFVPVSALRGENLTERPPAGHAMGWYDGPCLLELLDAVRLPRRDLGGFARACVSGKYRDGGYYLVAKVEKGVLRRGETYRLCPQHRDVAVQDVQGETEGTTLAVARAGDNCRFQVPEEVYTAAYAGCVLCDRRHPCESAGRFVARFLCLTCPTVLSVGFQVVVHVNTATTQARVSNIIGLTRQGKIDPALPKILRPGQVGLVEFQCADEICVNRCDAEGFLGRVLVRRDTETIGMGSVVKLCHD